MNKFQTHKGRTGSTGTYVHDSIACAYHGVGAIPTVCNLLSQNETMISFDDLEELREEDRREYYGGEEEW